MANGSDYSGSTSTGTLMADTPQPPNGVNSLTSDLISTLSTSAHTLLTPSPSLHTSAVALAKSYLDPLALSVSQEQIARARSAGKKRKRGLLDEGSRPRPLQLNKVYVDGFTVPQIWEQARRVIDAACEEVENSLPEDVEGGEATGALDDGEEEKRVKFVRFDDDGFELSESEDESLGEDVEDTEEISDGMEQDELEDMEDEEELEDAVDEEEDLDDELEEDVPEENERVQTFVEDPNGLNDGFFSIDEFNKQSEFLEQQDAAGNDDGAASDEEEIDWDADPMAMNTQPSSSGRSRQQEDFDDENEDEEDESEEDGPTFGNMDLNAPEGESDEEEDLDDLEEDEDPTNNTNDIYYKDFFAPPARKASAIKTFDKPSKRPLMDDILDQREDDVERTMSAVHRDLFEDDLSERSASPASDVDPGDPRSRRSTHERNQAKIMEEIRRLEAANVKKREWTLSGEARAADRPVNSLLEEDLEFERVGKPVPVITAEVSQDIEELIKRRILAKEFDEVIRRRPGTLDTNGEVRRGRVELDDSKPQQSLAEIYEAEHLRKTDSGYVDPKNDKLRKEHAEIEQLWKEVSAQLDALSSWHYKPKPAVPSLNVVTDVAAVTMEDARPTAGGDVASGSMLAPQEVYKAGEERQKGEVVPKTGVPMATEEMTREQKLRRRRREKERQKKQSARDGGAPTGGKKQAEKKNIIGDLKKGGVKVIGKKGELLDVEGKKLKGQEGRSGAGSFKL